MRSFWCTKRATSETGFTVLEMLIVASIAVVVAVAFYDALRQGWLWQTGAARLEESQSAASQALREIVDGPPDGSVPGLVAAREVTYGASSFAYAAGGREVSYYLADGTLYRALAPDDGSLGVKTSGGSSVVQGITYFSAQPDGRLAVLVVAAGDPSAGKQLVRLSTKVRPRNAAAPSGMPVPAPSVTTAAAELAGDWAVGKRYAVGTVRVEASADLAGYGTVEMSVRYRREGESSWTYTEWETVTSASYVKEIFRTDWAAGATYWFEAAVRFASPYQYAYGGEKAVEMPSSFEPGPPPPPSEQER